MVKKLLANILGGLGSIGHHIAEAIINSDEMWVTTLDIFRGASPVALDKF